MAATAAFSIVNPTRYLPLIRWNEQIRGTIVPPRNGIRGSSKNRPRGGRCHARHKGTATASATAAAFLLVAGNPVSGPASRRYCHDELCSGASRSLGSQPGHGTLPEPIGCAVVAAQGRYRCVDLRRGAADQ